MTRDEALRRASLALEPPYDPCTATALIKYAEEMRLGSATPALERLLGQASKSLPAERAGQLLTLHDIEAAHCDHGQGITRIRIRDRRAPTSRWMHPDDRTMCS